MAPTLKSILQNYRILLTHHHLLTHPELDLTHKNQTHKSRNTLLVMNHLSSLVVASLEIVQHNFRNRRRNILKDRYFLQIQIHKILLIRLPLLLLANRRNRHQLLLVTLVNKITKTLLFSQPPRISIVLRLAKINRLSIRITVVPFTHHPLTSRNSLQPTIITMVTPFDLIVNNGQEIKSLVHYYFY